MLEFQLFWTWLVLFDYIRSLLTATATGLHPQLPYSFQVDHRNESSLFFSNTWNVVGPFQVGTREAAWGADPLEAHGGFRTIQYDPNAEFKSSLGKDGTIKWSTIPTSQLVSADSFTEATLDVAFPEVNWQFFQSIYGWAALQYQAWARGSLTVSGDVALTVALFTDGILEFFVDNKSYFGGDFYGYRRAPLVLYLEPGQHVMDLRLVRDVRAHGGVGLPRIKTTIEARQVPERLNVNSGSILISEVVKGRLLSPFASVVLQNARERPIEVLWVESLGKDPSTPDLSLLNGPIILAPSQSRALPFRITTAGQVALQLSFRIGYRFDKETDIQNTEQINVTLKQRSITQAQKFTFIHPSGVVSYAILRPPPHEKCRFQGARNFPVLIGLHGAGLEADSQLVRHMLDGAYGVCAWIIFPTGVTPWSGDDWHTWGYDDVGAAVSAIPDWLNVVAWDGPGVSLNDWIVTGHSNGGQGTWYILSHFPDKVVAAAPVSGYTSIENYVPFSMWWGTDALLAAVLQVARQSFQHELLSENFIGIPILQQHGSDDDNVPVYHSRLMHQTIWEHGWSSQYDELPGKGHWFDGVLTTTNLTEFYHVHSKQSNLDNLLPVNFTVLVPPSSDMGSRGGIIVDQLQSPDRSGHISVVRETETNMWRLKTKNIQRFHLLLPAIRAPYPLEIQIDDSDQKFPVSAEEVNETWYSRGESGEWVTRNLSWQGISMRYGRQVGANAILHTVGTLNVVSVSGKSDRVALQVCQNLFQYFKADCSLTTIAMGLNAASSIDETGNLITVVLGDELKPSKLDTFPVILEETYLVIKTSRGCGRYGFEPGLGAIFLRPLKNERLELVIWGADLAGLRQASRLIPTLTGVGQPDFVVVNSRGPWKGRGGVYAAGFFDYSWQVSSGSYIS